MTGGMYGERETAESWCVRTRFRNRDGQREHRGLCSPLLTSMEGHGEQWAAINKRIFSGLLM